MASTSHKSIKTRITLAMVVLLAVFIGITRTLSNQMPVMVIPPPPKIPSPNAYDYYLLAEQKLRKAANKATYNGKHFEPVWGAPQIARVPLAEKELTIAVTGESLQLLHDGFKYSYQAPLKRSFSSNFVDHLVAYRNLANYLDFRASMLATHHDWYGAVDSSLDAIRLGMDPPKEGRQVSSLLGIAIQNIGRFNIWQPIGHLTGVEARAATLRAEQIMQRQTSLLDSTQGEKNFVHAALLEIFQQPDWRKELGANSLPSSVNELSIDIQLLTMSKKRIISDYDRYSDFIIAQAKKPYPLRKHISPSAGMAYFLNPTNDDIAIPMCNLESKFVVNEVENALLLTALALQAYKAEHGAYPLSLTNLTLNYLKALPVDPFAVSGPLHYRRTADKYLLYSIGPDGKDDSGKPIDSGNTSSTKRYQIFPNNKPGNGDVVAGVNIF